MNKEQNNKNTSRGLLDISFIVAVIVLGLSWAGFGITIEKLRWVTSKQPVPWPEGVTVNNDDFRLTNLPLQMGPYKRVEDGEFPNDDKPGEPDGERVLTEDILESLKIGTSLDKDRVADRKSNWYVSRIYIDTTKSPNQPFRYWLLDVTYYTGGLEKVPHIPERCLTASGAQLLGDSDNVWFTVDGIDKKYEHWQGRIAYNRTRYVRQDPLTFREDRKAQFYIFSLNGKPEADWEMVRGKLTLPFGKYAYFAKIQFAPMDSIDDEELIIEETEKFVKSFLPHVVKTFAMPQDIKRLEKSEH